MRSRAAFLPHPADPFLFKYWLKFYQTVWRDEIDTLYIYLNSPIEKPVVEYMRSLVDGDPKINFEYVGFQVEHGTALNEMLEKCKEEYIMLIEDDGYIFKPGIVNECFEKIESGEFDIVGSPRGSCSMEIYEAARSRFNLSYEGYGDHGPNFWPNFFFTKRQYLLETDRNFGAKAWTQGQVIESLGYTVKDEVCPSDTFVNASLQLRAKGYKILEIPQYHASTDDLADFEPRKNIFDGKAPWIHVGSLSSGVHGILLDGNGRSLGRRTYDPPKDHSIVPGQCTTEQERLEWERRITFWSMAWDNSDSNEIPEFRTLYRQALDRVVEQFGLSPSRIERKKSAYHTLGL